jgi:hypothetical protein
MVEPKYQPREEYPPLPPKVVEAYLKLNDARDVFVAALEAVKDAHQEYFEEQGWPHVAVNGANGTLALVLDIVKSV